MALFTNENIRSDVVSYSSNRIVSKSSERSYHGLWALKNYNCIRIDNIFIIIFTSNLCGIPGKTVCVIVCVMHVTELIRVTNASCMHKRQ